MITNVAHPPHMQGQPQQEPHQRSPLGGWAIAMAATALFLSGCSTTQNVARRTDTPAANSSRESAVSARSHTAVQRQLIDDAAALEPLAMTALGKSFLRATEALPAVATRVVYRDDNTREYFSPDEAAAMPEEKRRKLASIELDEYRYYYTKYGSPLAYLRAIDLAASNGLNDVKGAHILDFGYGSIGHLRLLASLGANVVGVDPDSYLDALYSQPSADQGSIATARNFSLGSRGSITLAHGRWPGNVELAQKVAKHAPYQLIVSKNTLKRGYLKPERRAAKNQLIDLGVTDERFLKAIHDSLAPGGLLVIYNLAPKPAPPDKEFQPQADARSPFSAAQFARAGLDVVAMNTEDHDFVRRMGVTLGWDKNSNGEVVNDLNTNLFALYTIVRRAK